MREYRAIPATRRPRADIVLDQFDDMAVVRDMTVFEPAGEWQDSGLLDAAGAPLMRRDRIGPIGFIHPRDER
ncbi:hypothetical protein LNAOJCKE_2999 [Methylorubrum aminovorans]|uniref:Uncharacterized protein n=1 Tax=Methylorubrum aminovorans TaxID=269069 RepID=A0ABQ4UER1_9HYPH|nr:hypothetical protein [Methylorubrum aminovorans]GJE65786.1 hypothetical protein LNAOJCKE_2999 [Methylorubrum aminovorans]GMA75857.1 hypothetical protein GCM10025880_22740 [Methylorubrum aminovorans]